jgi:hypothetical protein
LPMLDSIALKTKRAKISQRSNHYNLNNIIYI